MKERKIDLAAEGYDEKNEFYEDVGDPLATFRKHHKGGAMDSKKKKGKDPFRNDPDSLQGKRQEKLEKDQNNSFYGKGSW